MTSLAADIETLHQTVGAARRGNRVAADQLVREHDGWVRSVIYGVTGRADRVEDIAQQVWMQVWERLDSLQDASRLRPWLYSVARNAAIDAGQAARRREAASLDQAGDIAPDRRYTAPPSAAIRGELEQTLLRAVEALPALYREPFVLRHLEDWTYSQIGELLGLPVETVETRLVRARRLLREMLAGKVDE
ncbi:MAG: RNA polymerase sigma factor [Phycisphaerae bacterium]